MFFPDPYQPYPWERFPSEPEPEEAPRNWWYSEDEKVFIHVGLCTSEEAIEKVDRLFPDPKHYVALYTTEEVLNGIHSPDYWRDRPIAGNIDWQYTDPYYW